LKNQLASSSKEGRFEDIPIFQKMEDWGDIELIQIDSDDFWSLFFELCNDESGFLHNRSTILEAYKHGNLYGLQVNETCKMLDRRARRDKIFCENSWYLLPCFCVKENNNAIIIWTHTRARKMGFARKLVELLHIEYAYKPLPDSIDFWKKCNVKFIYKLDFQNPTHW
jgi:hypothetical protein